MKWWFYMIPVHERRYIAGFLNPAHDKGCQTFFGTRAEALRWLYRQQDKEDIPDGAIDWQGLPPRPEQLRLPFTPFPSVSIRKNP